MSETTQGAAVRFEVTVEAPVERAFRVFTEQFDRIKPREHNLLAPEPIAETVFETWVGGHVYDRGEDGSVCRWARVLAFEPPHRLVISWDISPAWQLVTDPAEASEVEVRFVAEVPERTRVELEHRHLERHGAGWESVRDGVGDAGGWPLYLERYVAALAG
ncbi:SRPBCC family protein [Pimelobacter simplex]|uniref:SRPBCC family protein n=1 Tax=Nocardioides simplex TaxID=2045 RepID=UPI0019342DFE|nr:SRPBCC domain-containing protein [Pimelobacter simplex]